MLLQECACPKNLLTHTFSIVLAVAVAWASQKGAHFAWLLILKCATHKAAILLPTRQAVSATHT